MGVLEILLTAVPSGFLGSIVGWFVNRKLHKAKSLQEQQMIYKQLYEDIQETLKQVIDEKKEIIDAFNGLQAAIYAIGVCRYAHQCPVTVKLQGKKRVDTARRTEPKARSDHREDEGVISDDTESDCKTDDIRAGP